MSKKSLIVFLIIGLVLSSTLYLFNISNDNQSNLESILAFSDKLATMLSEDDLCGEVSTMDYIELEDDILVNLDTMKKFSSIISVDPTTNMVTKNNSNIDISYVNDSEYVSLCDFSDYNLVYSISENVLTLSNPYETKRLIVFSDENIDSYGATMEVSGYKNYHIFKYSTEEEMLSAYEHFKSNSAVTNVIFDSVTMLEEVEEDTVSETSSSYLSWGASSMSISTATSYLSNQTLNNVYVAVIDTGIDTDHYMFSGRIDFEHGKALTVTTSSSEYKYEDDHGHGTHVSGIITDLTLSNVKIIPIKVMNSEGKGSVSSILTGLEYILALKNEGVNIVAANLSLGGSSSSEVKEAYEQVIDELYDANVLSVVAAGNEHANATDVSPANISSAITVSAVGDTLKFASSYSNYGSVIDVCAPGTDILSASIDGTTTHKSGTSMAAPHISAVVALISSMTSIYKNMQMVEDALFNNLTDLGTSGFDIYYGYGYVNLSNIVNYKSGTVVFDHTQSYYEDSFELTLEYSGVVDSNEYVVIYYGIDGDPENIYTSPITITASCTVNAYAVVYNGENIASSTEIVSQEYLIGALDHEKLFKISDSGYITSYLGNEETLSVPDSIGEILVVGIDSKAFLNNTSLRSVTLPDACISIESYAFYGCVNLSYVYAQNVTKIGEYSFSGTAIENLTDENLENVTTISDYAFYNCSSLINVNLSKLEYVGKWAFAVDYDEANVLQSLTLSSVTKIDEFAFLYRSSLENITLPKCEFIGAEAFMGTAICEINLENLTFLGYGAFRAVGTVAINLPCLTEIAMYAFAQNEIQSVYLPSVSIIGEGAFLQCTFADGVTFDFSNTTKVGSYAFYSTLQQSEVKLKFTNMLRFVHDFAFNHVDLSQIDFSGVLVLGSQEFDCENAYEIDLSSVSMVGYLKCDMLEKIIFTESLNYFYGFNLPNATFVASPNSKIYDFCTDNNYKVQSMTESGIVFETVGTSLDAVMIISAQNYTASIIASTILNHRIVKIADNAFEGNTYIQTINMAYLEEIGNSSFKGCENLTTIYAPNLKVVGSYAFYNCQNLSEIYSDSLQNIGSYAFVACSLSEFEENIQLLSVGEYALGYTLVDETLQKIEGFLIKYQSTALYNYVTSYDVEGEPFYVLLTENDFSYSIYYSSYSRRICIDEIYDNGYKYITIPSAVNGIIVGKLGESAIGCNSNIVGIKFSSTISLDSFAIFNCDKLEYIDSENIISLSEASLYNLSSVRRLTFTKLESYESESLYNLENLQYLYLSTSKNSKSITSNLLYYDSMVSKLKVVDFGNFKGISNFFLNTNDSYTYYAVYPYLESVNFTNVTSVSDTISNLQEGLVIEFGSSIDSISLTLQNGGIIYGYEDTQAETYATENGYTFYTKYGIITQESDYHIIDTAKDEILSLETVIVGDIEELDWQISSDGETFESLNISSNILTLDVKDYFGEITQDMVVYLILTGIYGTEKIESKLFTIYILSANSTNYYVDISCGTGGSVTGYDSSLYASRVFVDDITDGNLYIEPKTSFGILSITLNDEVLSKITTMVSFENVTSNQSLSVEFIYHVFFVDISINDENLGSATEGQFVNYGEDFVILVELANAMIELDYELDNDSSLSLTLTLVGTNNNGGDIYEIVFENVTSMHVLSIIFSLITYKVTYEIIGYGQIVTSYQNEFFERNRTDTFTQNAYQSYIKNSTLTMYFVGLDEVYKFYALYVNGELCETENNAYVIDYVQEDLVVKVYFARYTADFTIHVGDNGTLSDGSLSLAGEITRSYTQNQTLTFTATANEGYVVDKIVITNSDFQVSDIDIESKIIYCNEAVVEFEVFALYNYDISVTFDKTFVYLFVEIVNDSYGKVVRSIINEVETEPETLTNANSESEKYAYKCYYDLQGHYKIAIDVLDTVASSIKIKSVLVNGQSVEISNRTSFRYFLSRTACKGENIDLYVEFANTYKVASVITGIELYFDNYVFEGDVLSIPIHTGLYKTIDYIYLNGVKIELGSDTSLFDIDTENMYATFDGETLKVYNINENIYLTIAVTYNYKNILITVIIVAVGLLLILFIVNKVKKRKN